MMPRLLPTLNAWLLSTLFVSFQWRKDFNFIGCFKVIILKNRIKRALKNKDVVNPNKEEGMTNEILLQDLINMKHRNNFYVGVLSSVCLPHLFNL